MNILAWFCGYGLMGILCAAANGSDILRKLPQPNPKAIAVADHVLANQFTFQGVTGSPGQSDTGQFDWQHGGPKKDREWAWFLNRHRYFEDLYLAHQATGDERYLEKLFQLLDDWLQQHAQAPNHINFSSAWRPLEAARRILESWDLVYCKLWQHPQFSKELKNRFLTTLDQHGPYLQRHHALFGNHLITEMLALLKLAVLRSAHPQSAEWKAYALEQLEKQYQQQFYPAGVHKELSAHYQRVVLLNYQLLINFLKADNDTNGLQRWQARVDEMWAYLAAIQKPNGYAPINNDADRENIRQLSRQHVGQALSREAKNHYFKLAGQVIFAQDSGPHPLWAFFDIGPRGTDHQHEDFLHLSLSLGKADFLVDNGRYTYQPGRWRSYFQSERSHNGLLIDGIGCRPQPNEAMDALPGCGFTDDGPHALAWGSAQFSTQISPLADWQRMVLQLTPASLLVLDHLICFEPRQLVGFWHGAPQTDWQPTQPLHWRVENKAQRLHIQAMASEPVKLRSQLIIGQIEPEIQGWHSARFNQKVASPCLHYTTQISEPTVLAWLFSHESDALALHSVHMTDQSIHVKISKAAKIESLTIDLPRPLKNTARIRHSTFH